MKVKTYQIEVIRTATVLVTLPETMATDETIKSWESGLWKLENREADIAKYAAIMAVEHPDGDHDGLGRMVTSRYEKADYEKDKHQIIAIVLNDDHEETIEAEEDWREHNADSKDQIG